MLLMIPKIIEFNVSPDGRELAATANDEACMFGITISTSALNPGWHIAVKQMRSMRQNFVTTVSEMNTDVRDRLIDHFDTPSCFDVFDTLLYLVELMEHTQYIHTLKSAENHLTDQE